MGRKLLAVIVALIVAFAIIALIQMLSSTMVAPMTAEIKSEPSRMRDYMANLPTSAYIVVLISYILGSFGGGFIVTKMSRQVSSGIGLPMIIAVLLLIAGILYVALVPGQPVWFIVLTLLIFIPFTLIGHRLAR
jgi:hypothetical protein